MQSFRLSMASTLAAELSSYIQSLSGKFLDKGARVENFLQHLSAEAENSSEVYKFNPEHSLAR